MATTSSAPAGGLRTQAPGCDAQLGLHFIALAPTTNLEYGSERLSRLMGRATWPNVRSHLVPSGCSRQDGYCWKMTSLSISAAALSIF